MTTFDWTLKHKLTRMYLGPYGLVDEREGALFYRCTAQPYHSASVKKQGVFAECFLKGLNEADFMVHGGHNEIKNVKS